MNTNAPANHGKNVFYYGSKSTDNYDGSMKPQIQYLGNFKQDYDSNKSVEKSKDQRVMDKYKITFTNCNDKDNRRCSNGNIENLNATFIYLEPQKWHNLVFNYNNNIADLFINGSLKHSVDLGNNVPKYNSGDTMLIGDENLNGAICNITYYSNILTRNEIIKYYNLLIHKKPPVNNLI